MKLFKSRLKAKVKVLGPKALAWWPSCVYGLGSEYLKLLSVLENSEWRLVLLRGRNVAFKIRF